MSDLIWLALICAIAYTIKPMLPDYLDLTGDRRGRIDDLRARLDDQQRTVWDVVKENEQMRWRIDALEQARMAAPGPAVEITPEVWAAAVALSKEANHD